MKERNLILVRHGQSEWNEKNLFTGWENPGLTKKGADEAMHASGAHRVSRSGWFICKFSLSGRRGPRKN